RNTGVVLSLPVPAFTPGRAFSDHFGQGFIQVAHSPSQIVGIDTTGVHRQHGDFAPKLVMGVSSAVTAGQVTLPGTGEWPHGSDPQVTNFGIQQIQRGQDVTPYPPSRSYFVTLSVDF